ncbi:DUF2142 domain-containing protein [Modestobacter sp. VKM Ac-2977]|uniref:DUF2142 domain-containing protein n=1 Tax=Modestobacter sp. VKM Ac-2977 TaxID=3004131 RepID=UPI0022AA7553|nr:DUF2142 domain-containing protein [Modestobacter sp. VKM Ac-2977]MCZ2822350.1 DUF2142 domain-containing protein [Modestobacter sp. VKM Ac-2977]
MRTDVGLTGATVSGPSRSRRGLVRFFVVTWLLLSVAMASWSLATPLFASPDESAQVVKAVAVARGELTGRTIETPGGYFQLITGVDVPAYYGQAQPNPDCFIYDLNEPPDCAPPFVADGAGDGEVRTWIGRYPPLYYAVVGLPSLLADGEAAVLSMRVASAVLCAAFYAVGLTALRASRHAPAMVAAGWLAITPTALFFGGMVNSSALEIAAGFATWCLLVPLVRDPGGHDVRRRLAAGTVTAVVLLNTRPGSGLLALLIALCLVLIATREFWRVALSDRRWLPATCIAALGAVVAGTWLLVVEPTESLGGVPDPRLSSARLAVEGALDMTGRYVREQLAVFGWLNVIPPPVVLWSLGLTVAAVVVAGLAFGRGRLRWGVAALLVLSFALPIVSQVPSAAELGLIWQGRYGLPLSIGLPVVAMAAICSRESAAPAAGRARWLLIPFVAAVHVASFGWSLWRYTYGLDIRPFDASAEWAPPGGWLSPLAFVAASGCLTVFLLAQLHGVARAQHRDDGVRSGEPADPLPGEPVGEVR